MHIKRRGNSAAHNGMPIEDARLEDGRGREDTETYENVCKAPCGIQLHINNTDASTCCVVGQSFTSV